MSTLFFRGSFEKLRFCTFSGLEQITAIFFKEKFGKLLKMRIHVSRRHFWRISVLPKKLSRQIHPKYIEKVPQTRRTFSSALFKVPFCFQTNNLTEKISGEKNFCNSFCNLREMFRTNGHILVTALSILRYMCPEEVFAKNFSV